MNEEGNRFSAARTEFHSPEFKDVISVKPPALPKFDVPIETVFTESTLKNLRSAFDKGAVTLDRFMDGVIKLLALDKDYSAFAIPKLFNAVDTYRRGTANLCDYSYEDYQRRDIWMGEPKRTSLVVLRRVIGPKLHRPPPVKILELDDVHLLFSKDGTVSYGFVHRSGMSNAAIMTNKNLYVFQFRKNRVDGESGASDAGSVIAGHYNELPGVRIACFNLTLKMWDARIGRKKSEFRVSSPTGRFEDDQKDEELIKIKSRKNRLSWLKNFGPEREQSTRRTYFKFRLDLPLVEIEYLCNN